MVSPGFPNRMKDTSIKNIVFDCGIMESELELFAAVIKTTRFWPYVANLVSHTWHFNCLRWIAVICCGTLYGNKPTRGIS